MGRRHRNTPSPPAPPVDEELDLHAFSDFLHPMGLAIRDVANDGNCFFRAVSDQLYGTEQFHYDLRQRACDYIVRNKQLFIDFVNDDQSFDEYVADMRTDGIWADHIEIQAISMTCGVNIRVHQSGKPSYDIRNHLAADAPVIHLSYHFGEHYASVRPLRTALLPIPAQHPSLPLLTPRLPGDHSSSTTGDASPRRPRLQDAHSNEAIWKRAQRTHDELLVAVDATRRGAKSIRLTQPPSDYSDSEVVNVARSIEREMKDARSLLDRIRQTIRDAREVSLGENVGNDRKHSSSASSGRKSGRIRSSGQSRKGNDSSKIRPFDDDEAESLRKIREQTLAVERALEETNVLVSEQAQKLQQLKKSLPADAMRPIKGRKKKVQEEKKKERKERRRKEQQRLAQGRDFDDLPNIGSHREPLNIAAI